MLFSCVTVLLLLGFFEVSIRLFYSCVLKDRIELKPGLINESDLCNGIVHKDGYRIENLNDEIPKN